MLLRTCFLLFCVHVVLSAERGSSCTTPNGETATCVSINSCKIISEAIATRNKTAIEFGKQSQCGYDSDPLVCCGSSAYFTGLPDIFTKKPPVSGANPTVLKPIPGSLANNLLPDRTVCGLESQDHRLIGGEVTELDEFPWMVLLGYKNVDGSDAGFHCGGTLINNRYVLTAAHCVRGTFQAEFNLDRVRLGEWNISSPLDCIALADENCADPVVDIQVETELPHPFFNPLSGNNDIALLRIAQNVAFTDFIRPICLPAADFPPPPVGTLMSVCGWGAMENGSQSTVKLKVHVPIVSNADCAAKLNSRRTRISANQVCAGGVKGKDACKGDSGGPLMRTYAESVNDQQQWYQEGVVSRGVGCGLQGYPGVYTRVSRYLNWLLNNLTE